LDKCGGHPYRRNVTQWRVAAFGGQPLQAAGTMLLMFLTMQMLILAVPQSSTTSILEPAPSLMSQQAVHLFLPCNSHTHETQDRSFLTISACTEAHSHVSNVHYKHSHCPISIILGGWQRAPPPFYPSVSPSLSLSPSRAAPLPASLSPFTAHMGSDCLGWLFQAGTCW
jgi:hypothetical protein